MPSFEKKNTVIVFCSHWHEFQTATAATATPSVVIVVVLSFACCYGTGKHLKSVILGAIIFAFVILPFNIHSFFSFIQSDELFFD